jgi:hypothetical protein
MKHGGKRTSAHQEYHGGKKIINKWTKEADIIEKL